MMVPLRRLSWFLLPLILAGCNKGPTAQVATEPPKDALKELIKEDIVVGKPSRFNPKQKPLEKGDTVWVTYTGKFKTGKLFDSNDPKTKEGASPLAFQVGAGLMIRAWDEGLVGMLPGGRRKLSVPYKMAYGEKGKPGGGGVEGIPPFSDLYFDIVVHDYVKFEEQTVYDVYDVKKGDGPVVKAGSKVTVHTVVSEANGKVMEDTRKLGKTVSFVQGEEKVLRAIDDGVLGMRKGGIRELRLPPMIGFPPSSRTGANPNTLFFVRIEMIDVK